MATKTKWTKPLKVVTHYDLASLRGLLQRMAPKGKSKPSGFRVGRKYYSYTIKPDPPGQLRKSFGAKGAVMLSRSGKTILIQSHLPYARIQDKGGYIKAHTQPLNAPYMMFRGGGGVVFTRHRKGFRLKGQGYIKAAFNEWTSRRNIPKNIKVRWAKRGERGIPVSMRRTPGGA